MSDNDFQKWLDTVMQRSSQKLTLFGPDNIPSLRVSNNRYSHDATFEDRLSPDDKLLLHSMGIAV